MTIAQALILGGLQGVTEFLPVSSSAHLVILQYFFGLEGPILLVFDVVVHVGTLLAILVFFAKDWFPMSKLGKRMVLFILLATVPTAAIGFYLKQWVDIFFMSLKPVAVALVINSLILWSTRWIPAQKKSRVLGWIESLWIGAVQGISVIPGISRSGATITTGLWLKLGKEETIRFSFLIAIPAILGAMVVIFPEALSIVSADQWQPLLFGFISAFVFGYVSLKILVQIVLKGKLHYFALYTLFLALVSIWFSK